MKLAHLAVLLASAGCLWGCGRASETTPAPAPLQPVASIIDLMKDQIDPAADFLWESVATVSTLEGTVEHQPRTDEEWLQVRLRALQLAEAANLLMIPGRQVGHPGQQADDLGTPGYLSIAQAQSAIDAERDIFLAYAAALRDTAVRAVSAVDQRNLDEFLEVGGQIDEACEQCHQKFWYPGAAPPPLAMR